VAVVVAVSVVKKSAIHVAVCHGQITVSEQVVVRSFVRGSRGSIDHTGDASEHLSRLEDDGELAKRLDKSP